MVCPITTHRRRAGRLVADERRSGRCPLLTAVSALPVLTGWLLTAEAFDPAFDLPTCYRASHGTAKPELPSSECWRGFRKDYCAPIGLIQQGGPRRRETLSAE